jgi:MMPL family
MPLLVFVFLVALGVDYNVFLMTRAHGEARQHGPRQGALLGLAATGGVITSAGLVLAGTFVALATLPLVFVTEIGFAVAFGVLLDTFVVRSVLVTALSLDLGRWIWWPSRLFRKRWFAEHSAPRSIGRGSGRRDDWRSRRDDRELCRSCGAPAAAARTTWGRGCQSRWSPRRMRRTARTGARRCRWP